MGKLNFRGYLTSRFYPTCEISENLMHAKNMFYSIKPQWLPGDASSYSKIIIGYLLHYWGEMCLSDGQRPNL